MSIPPFGSAPFSTARTLGVYNVKTYGAKGNGVTDDSAAIAAAFAAAPSGAVVYFPPGDYRVSSTINVNKSVTIRGAAPIWAGSTGPSTITAIAGCEALDLLYVGSDSTQIAATIEKLQFHSAVTKTAGAAIRVGSANITYIQEVQIQSHYDAIAFTGTGIEGWVDRCSLSSSHDGITWQGRVGVGPEYRITNTVIANGGTNATGAGLRLAGIDGLFFSDVDVVGYTYGVYCDGTIQSASNCYFTNVLLDTCTYGMVIDGAFAHDIYMSNCYVAPCLLPAFAQGQTGIWIKNGAGRVGLSNMSIRRGAVGIKIDSDVGGVSVSGSNIVSLSGTYTVDKGIVFGAAATSTRIIGNNIKCATTDIDFGSFTHTGLIVADNQLVVAANVPSASGMYIHHNQGALNPGGSKGPPSMPSSTSALTNPYGFDCSVYVAGGTVTAIAVGGTATGVVSGTVRVAAGQTITLTYSSAPAWKWIAD